MAGIYYAKGQALPALREYQKCLLIRQELRDSAGMAVSNYLIGLCYKMLGQFEKSMKHYQTSMKLYDKVNQQNGKADILNGIGSLLDDQAHYEEAIKFYRDSYSLYHKLNDVSGVATTLNNIGKIHSMLHASDSAIYYYKLVIKYRLDRNHQNGLVPAYNNLATEYSSLGEEDLAITYYNQSYEIAKRLKISDGLAWTCNGLAWTCLRKKDTGKALKYAEEGLKIAKELGNTELLKALNEVAYHIYEELKSYYLAHEHFKQFKLYEDTLLSISNREATIKGQMQYEFDKKELLVKGETDRLSLMQKQEISKQRWIIYSGAGGLLIVISFSFFLYGRFKVIRKQKRIIERQKELVEEKQKEILDSIHYARRIQQSLLPSEKIISRALKSPGK